jgi:hypothetical protein
LQERGKSAEAHENREVRESRVGVWGEGVREGEGNAGAGLAWEGARTKFHET